MNIGIHVKVDLISKSNIIIKSINNTLPFYLYLLVKNSQSLVQQQTTNKLTSNNQTTLKIPSLYKE